ncbi:D-alanyl-D-alanine carboxypeptidase family protein [Altererythrobacter sp. B11]|uniref:D-alanyl-D-alanine carboxypeptidase family protein n=1 Tax=Altererythrobacter sp. B11 TaxID=2060312 RepID=UPI001E3F8C83|nr:D-alanyl-D-alanine carboxypeptidase family protein [Altererythrobacter sp. B11]
MKPTIPLLLALATLPAAAVPAAPLPGSARATQPVRAPDVPAAPVPAEIPVALLVDLSSGQVLFSRDPDRRFMPASVTKVMTAYSAFRLISEGKLSPERHILISKALADEWSGEGSSMFLKAGDRVTIGQLLLGITTVSANDGAVAVALEAAGSLGEWLALMNANAAELGMRDTHFGTPNGWPDEGRTFTSARDLALLAEAMVTRYPELYHRYFGHRGLQYGGYAQNNHDPVTGVVEGADGIKTGYTRQAGYNFLGSAERGGRRLVMVLAGSPTAPLRDKTARDLLRWGFDAFQSRVVLPRDMAVGQASVQGGASTTVGLKTEGDVLASMAPGKDAAVTMSVRYRGPVQAPVKQGTRVAFLHVAVAGQEAYDVPLVASETVPEANPLQRIRNGLLGMFS